VASLEKVREKGKKIMNEITEKRLDKTLENIEDHS
jgi:hypothetical protein